MVIQLETGEQIDTLGVLFRIEPDIGHTVAGEKVAYLVIAEGVPRSQNTQTFKGRPVAFLPGFQQVVEHRVEALFGRVPWLGEVVVDLGRVDGLDGCLGIGIGGQQGALRVRVNLHRLTQKLHPGHSGHALVGDKQGDDVAPLLQLVTRYQAPPDLTPRAGYDSWHRIGGADPGPPPPGHSHRRLPRE